MFHNFTTTWWVVCNCLQTSSYLSWKLLATTATCYLPKLLSWSQNYMNLHEPVVEYTVLTSDCIYHRVTNRFLGLYERELSNQLHAIANNLQQWLTTVQESAFFPQRFLGSHQQAGVNEENNTQQQANASREKSGKQTMNPPVHDRTPFIKLKILNINDVCWHLGQIALYGNLSQLNLGLF